MHGVYDTRDAADLISDLHSDSRFNSLWQILCYYM